MKIPELLIQISPLILTISGWLVHEWGHYVLGWIFGGSPYFDQYAFRIPTRVNFETPKEMENWQVKITGGWPYTLLIMLLIALWLHIEWLVFFTLAGALSISPSDLNAAWHPEFWKKLTAGETIYPEDFQDG